MILAFQVCGGIVAAALLGLFVFGLRRRLLQRPGGTFDCSLRPAPSDGEEVESTGKGWVYGVARYSGDRIEWFRVFSYSPRPRRVLDRPAIEVVSRRPPQGQEELALLSDATVLLCAHPRHPPGTGDERGRPDGLPGLARSRASGTASQCRLNKRASLKDSALKRRAGCVRSLPGA